MKNKLSFAVVGNLKRYLPKLGKLFKRVTKISDYSYQPLLYFHFSKKK